MAVCGPHHQRAPVVQEGGDSEREREREGGAPVGDSELDPLYGLCHGRVCTTKERQWCRKGAIARREREKPGGFFF